MGYELDPHPWILMNLPDPFCSYRGWVEAQSIAGRRCLAELTEDFGHALRLGLTCRGEVQIPSRAIDVMAPDCEEEGALQQKAIRVLRSGEPIEEPLEGEASEDELELLSTIFG